MRMNVRGWEERWLWPYVDKSGDCWLWTRAAKGGYGVVRVEGKQARVHRYVFIITKGEPQFDVLHSCGVRLCCNPDHLYDGDDKQNAADRDRHGRTAHNSGEVNGNARLTADQVSSIRADSRPVLEIAAEFGINKRYVYRIKAGERWKPH